MSDDLLFITPLNGPAMLGNVRDGDEGADGEIVQVFDAIICERIRFAARAPGEFNLQYFISPIDVYEQAPQTIFTKVASYLVVKPDSKLAKLYEATLKEWQAIRAGLVLATPQDVQGIAKGGNGS